MLHEHQRCRLSIQATKIMSKESDPFQSFQHSSHNLPLHSNVLSMKKASFNVDTMHWLKMMSYAMKILNPSSHFVAPF